MPERKCHSCKRQDDWGCHAYRWETTEDDPDGLPDRDGRFWRWEKGSHLPIVFMGEETHACPRQAVRDTGREWGHLLKFYAMYKQGYLPASGAVVDQSNKAVELFAILDDINGEVDRELDKSAAQKRAEQADRERQRGQYRNG